jgi:hypothetical protein
VERPTRGLPTVVSDPNSDRILARNLGKIGRGWEKEGREARIRVRSAETPNAGKVDHESTTMGTISRGRRTAIIVIVAITVAIAVVGFVVVTQFSEAGCHTGSGSAT